MRRDKIDPAKGRREKTILLRERERSVYVMMKRERKKNQFCVVINLCPMVLSPTLVELFTKMAL